ncbi:hypothetical protein Pmani_014616 [Petrolisthes manimaculis]|uniref:Hexosyltransferase n=1 Tax=Petrolisthes manimaculis TaxID=1843537 RepID=A0AAE1PSL3_9EUCA|nr:hypothetical protein Pmani_014616 [Petrolisthes manimaculis]
MSGILKSLIFFGRQSSPLIIGLCIGIALSLILTPFLEDDCSHSITQEILGGTRVGNLRDLRSNGPSGEEDYEPRLVLRNYSKEDIDKLSKPDKLSRPRYYTTELGMREKLLVAVVSTRETVGSYGISLNKTLSQYVDKLIFFLDGIGTKKLGLNIPIVGFKDEKPLLKVFRILSYINENYLNDFDYFFMVSDRTYVHGRRLYKLLQHISISENIYMGTLLDNPQSLYCSLDGGIILSHSVLRVVAESLSWCSRNTYSDSDTDNLGRCVLHAIDRPCITSIQGQQYSSYRIRDDVDVVSHLELIGSSTLVKEAVTVSNVPEASDIYALHVYYLQNDVQLVNNTIRDQRSEIERIRPSAPYIKREVTWPVGSSPPHYPATRFDVVCWEMFNSTHIFMPDDHHNTKPIIGADLHDLMSVVNASVAHMHNRAGGRLEYRELEYGHRRFDPARGVDYILSLAFRDNASGRIVSRKMEASRLLTEPEIVPMPYVTENTRITVVLPVAQDYLSEVTQSVKRYEAECMVKGEQTILLLALLYKPGVSSGGDNKDIYKPLKDLARKLTQEYEETEAKVKWMPIHMDQHSQQPSTLALLDLVVKKIQKDALVMLTHHSAVFTSDFLNRIRMNTIQGWQVFSMVPFTQYHQEAVLDQGSYMRMDVNRNNGHFDTYNYDHISFYVADYTAARKSESEAIPIIRTEKDLKFDQPQDFGPYGLFLRASSIHILRAPDPGLKLFYSDLACQTYSVERTERVNQLCELQEDRGRGGRKATMFSVEMENITDGLCASQKLERDRAVADLSSKIKSFSPDLLQSLMKALLQIVTDSSSTWESQHGCLLGLKVAVGVTSPDRESQFHLEVREIAIRLLTHQEVRVRQAAGEVLGALCERDGGATYSIVRGQVLDLVRSSLDRQATDDDASRSEHENARILMEKLSAGSRERRNSGDAAQIFHDTAGWRNLETSMKCLEHMINGAAPKFLPYVDQELLDLIFKALTHTNRFVRETGFNVCGALVSCGAYEGAELLESNPMFTFGDQLTQHLGEGLADNWSQVRLASSVATRKFLMSLPPGAQERFFPVLLPRLCLNRYYVAEGVRLYSQETWKQVTEAEGKTLVEKYINHVVSYYIEATGADNHAVREAACACIAELALKLNTEAVRSHVQPLLHALTVCFADDSWPVRDAACVACGNFILCFPEEAQGSMELLYPLFFTNLEDSIPSVRQGAAVAIANVVKAYGHDALPMIVDKMKEGLKGVKDQPCESERYGDLESGPAMYGVVKRKRDNDPELHSNKQMYSCGSLAPKMGRGGGGCSDCRFRRPPQVWERADGYVYLASELAGVPDAACEVTSCLPMVAEAVQHKHYAAHITLLETLCKTLPHLAKGLSKKVFKSQLHLFLDSIFYALECENGLTSSAACQCLTQLSQLLGPNILRGRVEEHNPSYLRALDANNFIAPL